jgi:hypothetical protein
MGRGRRIKIEISYVTESEGEARFRGGLFFVSLTRGRLRDMDYVCLF